MQNELESNTNPNGTPTSHPKNPQHCSVVVSIGTNRTIKSIANVHNYNTDLIYVQAEECLVLIRLSPKRCLIIQFQVVH